MKMEFISFWPLFFLVVASQGLFLATILAVHRTANNRNWLLAILMALFSISIFDTIVFWTGYYLENPHLLGISLSFRFIYGPLFFLYILRASQENPKNGINTGLHFLPFLLVTLWHTTYYFSDTAQKLLLIETWNHSIVNALLLPVLELVSLSWYGVLSWRHLQKLEQKQGIKILQLDHWLGAIFLSYCLFVAFCYGYFFTILFGKSSEVSDIIIISGYSIFIYFIGYLGLKMSRFLNGAKVDNSKYQTTALPTSISEKLFNNLKAHIEANQSYKNNDLKLANLAEELSLSPHHLSQIINQNANKNFSEFINAYRIQEAIQLIAQIDRISQLAYEVGFNNRTTFNKSFKKTTGLSPTEYKKTMLK